LITNSVCVGKAERELQNLIEDAILNAIGQRSLWRIVDVLRFEKRVLERGRANLPRATIIVPTQRLLIIIAAAVHRMQKLSGHLPGTMWREGRGHHVMERSLDRRALPVVSLVDPEPSPS
jgi:hypothetical protein